MVGEQWSSCQTITERADAVLTEGGVDHEVCGTGDEWGFWFGQVDFSEGGSPELCESFLGECLGVQLPREVEVIEVAFQLYSFFIPIVMYGGVIGFGIEGKHLGHVLVVVPQFMEEGMKFSSAVFSVGVIGMTNEY